MGPAPPAFISRVPGGAKKIIPIIVSVAIIYYYFSGQDWPRILEACARANLWLAVLALALPQLVFWFFETLIFQRHVTWFHAPFSFSKFFWVRGAIYILQFINPILGGGGTLLYIQRKSGMNWKKLTGIVLFRAGLTLWGVGFLLIPATLAMHYFGLADRIKLNLYIWWFILLAPGLFWFISNWLFWHHHFDTTGLGKLLVRDRESEFWTAFATSTPRQWVYTIMMVLPPFVLTIVGLYFLNLAFGVRVPISEFAVVAPLAALIVDLPIAFAGFGTTTVAWKTFFGDYATTEQIAAVTLFFPFGRMVIRALIGLVSLGPALRELGTLGPAPAQESDPAARGKEP